MYRGRGEGAQERGGGIEVEREARWASYRIKERGGGGG